MSKLISIVVLSTFVFFSCTTNLPSVNYKYPYEGYFNNAALAVKDYEPVGIIIVKSSEMIDEDGNHTGSKITHEMLMLEAKNMDANDVINIRIDINEVKEIVRSNYYDIDIKRTTYNYTATALAIKYTKAVTAGNSSNNKISASETETETNTNTKKSKTPWVILGIVSAVLIGGTVLFRSNAY